MIKYRDTQYVKHPIYFLFRSSFHVAPHNGSRIFLASRFRLVIFIFPSTHGLKNITNYYFPSINIYIYISFLETKRIFTDFFRSSNLYHDQLYLSKISSSRLPIREINFVFDKGLSLLFSFEKKKKKYLTRRKRSNDRRIPSQLSFIRNRRQISATFRDLGAANISYNHVLFVKRNKKKKERGREREREREFH